MSEKYTVIVGTTGSGKTTLASVLENKPIRTSHREDCFYHEHTVELPASYLENHWMHPHIVVICDNHAAQQVFLLSALERENPYSAGFAKALPKRSIGIVTHIDQASQEQIKQAQRWLCEAGVSELYSANLLDFQAQKALVTTLDIRGCAPCAL